MGFKTDCECVYNSTALVPDVWWVREMAKALTEEEIDRYLLAASQQYEEGLAKELATQSPTHHPLDDADSVVWGGSGSQTTDSVCPRLVSEVDDGSRFGPIVDQDDLVKIVEDSVPKKTCQQTKWCVSTWEEWHTYRLSKAKCDAEKPPRLEEMSHQQLDYWISCFIMEAKKKDGSDYIGETLHNMVCGLQRHLRLVRPDFSVDFLSGTEFRGLCGVLDAKMKGLKQKGIGVQKR